MLEVLLRMLLRKTYKVLLRNAIRYSSPFDHPMVSRADESGKKQTEKAPGAGGLRGELELGQAVRVDPLLAQAQQQAPRWQHPQLAQVPPPETLQRLPHLRHSSKALGSFRRTCRHANKY